MTAFNVLDRNEKIHCSKLLEASAGTGKTFSIENMVMRLLIEQDDAGKTLLIEELLVVTFTKAATRELRVRIRKKIAAGLSFLKNALAGGSTTGCPDYLLAKIEAGEESIAETVKLLERALFCYDKAQIFTIHGFCWRMLSSYALQAGISLGAKSQEDRAIPNELSRLAVKDFLRNGLSEELFSQWQLDQIVGHFKQDEEGLIDGIAKLVNSPYPINPSRIFSELMTEFNAVLSSIKSGCGVTGESLKSDFSKLAPNYGKKAGTYPELCEILASLFDRSSWEEGDLHFLKDRLGKILKYFDSSNLLKSASLPPPEILNHPGILNALNDKLASLMQEYASKTLLVARMAAYCQKFIKDYQLREEVFGHDQLLSTMRRALENEDFVRLVRNQFRAAIIDEFQDTDPLQWEIFSTLFLPKAAEWKGHLYLVGDPKQSIYAFRQADIYTYLAAAEAMGKEAHSTLDTNFRSTPTLVQAINALFGKAHEPFPLPRTGAALPYRIVRAGIEQTGEKNPPLRFWLVERSGITKKSSHAVEKELIIPAMANEILRLKQECHVGINSCAVLVADHMQGKRVADYFKSCGIPVRNQRGVSLRECDAFQDMIEILSGILDSRGGSAFKAALATRPIGMNVPELESMNRDDNIVPVLNQFLQLRKVLMEDGFAKFYRCLMLSQWHGDGRTVYERLLIQEGGSDYFRQWQDVADWIIAEEHRLRLTPSAIIAHLESSTSSEEGDEALKAYVDMDDDGVSIITMHYSKGLEFEAVFALGVIAEYDTKVNDLVPVFREGQCYLEGTLGEDDPKFKHKVKEDEAEKMRKLYVALTRAKTHLYLPVLLNGSDASKKRGADSDISLLIDKLARGLGLPEGNPRLCLEHMAANHPDLIELIDIVEKEPIRDVSEKALQVKLVPCKEFSIPGTKEYVHSFTSLSSHHAKSIEEEGEHQAVPHDFASALKNRHTLPSGNETGVILHKILEEVPFNFLAENNTREELTLSIGRYVRGTRFELWLDVIVDLFVNCVSTPLPGAKNAYRLSDLSPDKIFKETEFLYPFSREVLPLEGVEARDGYLKGVIDLFYEHDGKYYILDWKSNWLGPDESYYCPERLREAMKSNRYDLQAAIYADAMLRYLKLFDQRPFDELFGGVYYVFLRGIGPGKGILHFEPDLNPGGP